MIVSGGNRVRPSLLPPLFPLSSPSNPADKQGIGLAISHQIAQAGAHVAIIYKSSPDAPERAKEISEKYGVHCEAFKCDVSDQAAVQELVGRIYKDVGPVGGVVCNAGKLQLEGRGESANRSGVAVSKPASEMSKEDFDAQMNPNVWGCFTVAQAAVK